MTSKSSFLVRLRENNKRRVWVWIVSFLTMLGTYPGTLAVYISRIKHFNMEGSYATAQEYTMALCEAITDALGFHGFLTISVTFLAVIIGVQGFSYLYSRKKVDMYNSVPVSSKSRFAVIYVNGILTYIIPTLFSIVIAIIMATVQGGMDSGALAKCGLAFLMNFIYFMLVYNIVILAVMLTGNVFITALAIGVFFSIGYLWQSFFLNLKLNFFDSVCTFFDYTELDRNFSVVLDHLETFNYMKWSELSDIVKNVFSIGGKWFIEMLLIGALAFFCYIKRPAEAAGKAITYKVINPFLKVIISPTVGIMAFAFVYDASYANIAFSVAAMIIGTILCAGVMEIIYEFDMRAAIKNLISTGLSAVVVIMIFCIFYFDIFSYDSYVPKEEKVESAAICINPYTYQYYDFSGERIRSIDEGVYLKENMFITDVEPVLELAKNNQKDKRDTYDDERLVYILYRLKSGREVSRNVVVDFANASNAAILDRIMETGEYREGAYQISKDAAMITRPDASIMYKNGTVECNIPHKEGENIREAWLKDMENFNFSLARNNLPCGHISVSYGISYIQSTLPVYESFTNTIAVLEENNAYYPAKINPEDVLTLSVTNYNYEYDMEDTPEYRSYDGSFVSAPASAKESYIVSGDFTDPDEIAEIVKGLYSSEYSYGHGWISSDMFEGDYRVTVSYKSDSAYPYVKGYVEYRFMSGQMPEFVAQRTAVKAEGVSE